MTTVQRRQSNSGRRDSRMMNYYRLRFGEESSKRLEFLKRKTGITPNILACVGFCMSLNDPTMPDLADYMPDSNREIDRHTLTGQYDLFFVALLKRRCQRDELSEADLMDQFKAHMNRGVLLLDKRIRTVHDFALLLPPEYRNRVNGAEIHGH